MLLAGNAYSYEELAFLKQTDFKFENILKF